MTLVDRHHGVGVAAQLYSDGSHITQAAGHTIEGAASFFDVVLHNQGKVESNRG